MDDNESRFFEQKKEVLRCIKQISRMNTNAQRNYVEKTVFAQQHYPADDRKQQTDPTLSTIKVDLVLWSLFS